MIAIPPNAPFSPEQIGWLNGYLAARMQVNGTAPPPQGGAPDPVGIAPPAGKDVTLIWGSQTGSSESLAKTAAKKLTASGHQVTVKDMAEVEAKSLAEVETLFVITSTYGDGEPPDNAQELHEALHSDEAPPLSDLNYSVLGLGDSEYPDFNQCAKEFDSVLEKLGGKRLAPLIESDVDYDEPFDQWLSAASASLTST